MPVLHRACDQAPLAGDRLVAEVIEIETEAVAGRVTLFDCVLKVIEHLKVAFLENVSIWIFILPRSQPNGIDPEEWPKLFLYECLFSVCAG